MALIVERVSVAPRPGPQRVETPRAEFGAVLILARWSAPADPPMVPQRLVLRNGGVIGGLLTRYDAGARQPQR